MERMMTQEERIRRAEELYIRRKSEGRNNYYSNTKNISRDAGDTAKAIKRNLAKKMITQIIICVIIYTAIYLMQHSEQLFSKDFINKAKEILGYDISVDSLTQYWNNMQNTINEFLNKNNEENETVENTEESTNQESNSDEVINQESTNPENEVEENLQEVENPINNEGAENIQGGIGGTEEVAQVEEKTQEELDIEYIKQNINIIWPLIGTITSGFGARTPTEIVSANHYGTDIGGNTGDAIVAAIDGVVTLASSEGDYGKHLKIENEEVTTLYAHCSALLVKEGETIKQGQKIAEVGETGRATRPTFAF